MEISVLILVLTFQISTADYALPVFMIDSDHVMSHLDHQPNPFAKISVTHFTEIVHDATKRSECVLIFVEDRLCTEDISLKDKSGSPFVHLQQHLKEGKVKYMPSVADPYKMLTQILQPQPFNTFYLSSGMKLRLTNSLKYIYIFFQDLNESRVQCLRNHDGIIKEVYAGVRQMRAGPVVGFYTGKMNPVVLEKVEFVPVKPIGVPKDLTVMIVSEGAMFRFSGVYAATSARRSSFHQAPLIAEETWTRRKLSTTMAYNEFALQFNFSLGDDEWLLESVALAEGGEEVGRTELGVGAPWNWSYVCAEPLCVVNTRDGSALTISQYQIQPIHPDVSRRQDDTAPEEEVKEGANGVTFGNTVNCGPYFSAHILSGLFVGAICFAILTYGVLVLYNCGVNDKFDDVNGREPINYIEH